MHQSKLRRILEQFTKAERKSLKSFVQSPYHCSNVKVKIMLSYFIDSYTDEDNEKYNLDRLIIWNKIAPGEDFNYTYLRKIASDSIKIIEDFMIQQQLHKDVNARTYLLLENSKNRKNRVLQEIALSRYEQNKSLFFKRRNSVNIFNTQIIKNLFILNDFDKIRYKESGIDEMIFELDKFYITEKLKLLCELLSRNWDLDVSEFTFFKNIIEEISKNEKFKVPSILIYYYIYLTYSESDKIEYYYQLKNLILKHYSEFDEYEAKSLFDATLSYGIARMNKGDQNFEAETLNLFKYALENNAIILNGKIDPYSFKIIVMIGLRLSDFEWVEYFIETYIKLIPEEERDNSLTYNLALLNFYKKDYSKVMLLLQRIEYEDLTYNLGAKSMLLATYYELEEYDPLFSFMDTFKVYLNRKKQNIPKNFIDGYLNLIKFTRRLLTLPAGDKVKLEKLENDLQVTPDVASKKWLLEKIEQLR